MSETPVDPFAGHLGRLSDSQSEALANFKELVQKAGFTTHNDDVTLCRFLRARRFDPVEAMKQYSATQEWRQKYKVDSLFTEFPAEEFESSKRFYPRWTGRRDNYGLPVFIYQIACLQPLEKELTSAKASRRYERIIALHEHMVRFILPLCTTLPHPLSEPSESPMPISSVTTIIDLAGIQLSAMWRLRSHLQEASKLATANYPETLHTIAIVNAPGFFGTIWNWIKGWFDEGTRNKIHILGMPSSNFKDKENPPGDTNTTETLLSLMPASSLPRMYGGELEFTFLDDPVHDDDVNNALGVKSYSEFEAGPKVWSVEEKKWTKSTPP
ncbi:CRAL/TRIO domain-containing protein [Flagelloscypha sp. PMI_526]|nr:CRAL/TRIO domain-containing protein [Flagelloscypha sp. PMI_526]